MIYVSSVFKEYRFSHSSDNYTFKTYLVHSMTESRSIHISNYKANVSQLKKKYFVYFIFMFVIYHFRHFAFGVSNILSAFPFIF